MEYDEAIRAMLAADAAITAYTSTRIFDFSVMKRLGVAPTTEPSAFAPPMQPLIVVKGRAVNAGGDIHDRQQQVQALRQTVEVWLYDDGDKTFATALNPLKALVIARLNGKKLTGASALAQLSGYLRDRDPTLGYALFYRLEFQIVGIG